jgi:hypothetical protein
MSTNGKQIRKKMLNIFSYKEMKMKMTLKFHLSPIRMAITKETITNVDKVVTKYEPLYNIGGKVN